MVEKLAVEVALEGGEEVQRDLSKLEQGFVNAGLAVRDFATSFAEIAVVAGGAAIVAAAAAMLKFANAAEETTKQLTQLQKVSGATFENISALQQVFAAGGTTLNKFAAELGNVSEKIAAATQTKQIRDASKDFVQWNNDIDRVRLQFDNLASGVKTTFSPLTTLKTKVEAALESVGKISISMVPGVSSVRSAEEEFFKLADIFKNLSSDIERAQLGKALGLSPETITTLSRGSEALRQMQVEAQRLGLTLTTSNQQALQEMAAGWNEFTALLAALFQKIGAAAAPAFSQILVIFKQVMQTIISDFETLPLDQAIANLGNRLGPAFTALGETLSPFISALGEAVLNSFKEALTPTTSLWDAILNDFAQFGESLVQNAQILGEKIKSALGFSGGGGVGAIGGGEGFAGGGIIGGRGTGTSDSNLAWVSRGEHIMPARAVAQPGVLAFLEALRRTGGDLSRVLDGMGHFALGGGVPQMQLRPAFANGGLVEGRRVLNLNIEGRSFAGLSVPESTAQALERFAVHSQIASTGRKPSWRR